MDDKEYNMLLDMIEEGEILPTDTMVRELVGHGAKKLAEVSVMSKALNLRNTSSSCALRILRDAAALGACE